MERTRLLFGQFRKGEANDPAVFVASVAAVLSHYPKDVIVAATHPEIGLASRGDWLPTVREVRAICEELMAPTRRAEQRQKALDETAAKLAAEPVEKPTIEQLKAKYGETFGIGQVKKEAPMTMPTEPEKARWRQQILAEYARRGVEPVYSWGELVSPSLLASLQKISERIYGNQDG